ncbi:hypothetical protein L6452_08519 [Arctium lappa]|uniref:Uncharacterized protein n=1 Tax=Arctium lappa TaxID=4217 RepID=A0ACB9DHY7_ARCLA|nr:hypothetical protein L6452_08519 [Arctium lappa]
MKYFCWWCWVCSPRLQKYQSVFCNAKAYSSLATTSAIVRRSFGHLRMHLSAISTNASKQKDNNLLQTDFVFWLSMLLIFGNEHHAVEISFSRATAEDDVSENSMDIIKHMEGKLCANDDVMWVRSRAVEDGGVGEQMGRNGDVQESLWKSNPLTPTPPPSPISTMVHGTQL